MKFIRRTGSSTTTNISGAAVRWLMVLLMVAATSNSDVDPTPAGDVDWGCAAAAAQYQSLGDVDGVPMTLVEGERHSLA